MRICFATAFVGAVSLAAASWDNVHFCRLTPDRLVVLTAKDRFVLVHGAAWELADSAQKDSFGKWLTKSKLPADLGQLVAGAPKDHELLLAGEIDASAGADGETTLKLVLANTLPKVVKLTSVADGVKPDPEGVKAFADFAKFFKKEPSTLLVSLSDKSGPISNPGAWAAVLARLKAKPEFFVLVDKKQGLLWVKRVEAPAVTTPAATSHTTADKPAKTVPDSQTPKQGVDNSDSRVLSRFAAGIVGIFSGIGIGMLVRRRLPTQVAAPTAETPKFNVTAHERELVEKVRDEMRKLKWPPSHIPSADEFIVGQMIDRFNRSEALERDIAKLESYRQFKESHDAFQRKIDEAVAEAKATSTKAAELFGLLEQEKLKAWNLAEELKRAQDQLASTKAEMASQVKRIRDLERRNTEFQAIYIELMSRSSAVCHDMVLTRPRSDAWALAFVYLVDYTLAYLGLAIQCGNEKLTNAMLSNLSRLAESTVKSFPDRKLVVDPWLRAVKAFGDVKAPAYEQKPHPHVDSLSQIVLTLRDTGPSLSDFREFFAPSDIGLHIIRPA